jgi:hypothetical protein
MFSGKGFSLMQRVVAQLLLNELWDDTGALSAAHHRDLTAAEVRDLLRAGPVRFVVANVGASLRWVAASECFRFWTDEVQSRVGDPAGARLEDFPGGYCYFASEWGPVEGPPVVVLSVAH